MTATTPGSNNPDTNPTSSSGSSPVAGAGPISGSGPVSSSGSSSGSNSGSNSGSDRDNSQGNTDYGKPQGNTEYGKSESTPATAKVTSAAHTAVEVAAEKLAHTEKVLREAGGSSLENLSEYGQEAYDSAEDALASVKELITRNPLVSVGIALAAGFLLSTVVKRS